MLALYELGGHDRDVENSGRECFSFQLLKTPWRYFQSYFPAWINHHP